MISPENIPGQHAECRVYLLYAESNPVVLISAESNDIMRAYVIKGMFDVGLQAVGRGQDTWDHTLYSANRQVDYFHPNEANCCPWVYGRVV